MARKKTNTQAQLDVAASIDALSRAAAVMREATAQEISWSTGPHGTVDERAEAAKGLDPVKLDDEELSDAIGRLRRLRDSRRIEHLQDARDAVDYHNSIEVVAEALADIHALEVDLMEALRQRAVAADEQERLSLAREVDVDAALAVMLAEQQRRQVSPGRILDMLFEQGVALEDLRKAIDAKDHEARAKQANVSNKSRPVLNKARGAQTKSVDPMD